MSMRKACLIILAGVTVACSSNAPAGGSSSVAQDTAAVKAVIEASNARFLEAFKRGDKAGMIANYADDAIVMLPNEEAWRGRDGLEKGLSNFLSQMSLKDGSTTTADVMIAGDLAVETGSFEWTLQPKSGPEIKDKGKYLTVWKHQADGTWKAVRDINNSDLPAKM